MKHLLPALSSGHIPLDAGVSGVVQRNPAIHPAVLLATVPRLGIK